jgi:hypothetical protein
MAGLIWTVICAFAAADQPGTLSIPHKSLKFDNLYLISDTKVAVIQTSFQAEFDLIAISGVPEVLLASPPYVRPTQLLLSDLNTTSLYDTLEACQDHDLSFALVLTDSNISFAEVKAANVTVMRLSPVHGQKLVHELDQSEGKMRVSVSFTNSCKRPI